MSSCLFYEKPIITWVFKSNILIKGVCVGGGGYTKSKSGYCEKCHYDIKLK